MSSREQNIFITSTSVLGLAPTVERIEKCHCNELQSSPNVLLVLLPDRENWMPSTNMEVKKAKNYWLPWHDRADPIHTQCISPLRVTLTILVESQQR